jgi:hypothetical protein
VLLAVFLRAGDAPAQSIESSPPPLYVGAGSCAAAACHNANFARGASGSEYATWITRDPHARAYEALFDERSVRIQKNLGHKTPAHEDRQCLACHVAADYDPERPPKRAPFFKTDGVSCESCHGPAQAWIGLHHHERWRTLTAADKKRVGMNDTRSITGRAQLCVPCHVGTASMNVDHDLIAAGHPRLHFEFAAFHAHLPRHWPDYKDRDPAKSARGRADFEARAWAVGQLVTVKAALELLTERAGDASRTWPEFAEYDCAACHRDLHRERQPRSLAWGHLLALTPDAATMQRRDSETIKHLRSNLKDLHNTMRAGLTADRKRVFKPANAAVNLLRQMIDAAETESSDVRWLLDTLDTLVRWQSRSRDEATQLQLGVAALEQSRLQLRLTLPTKTRDALMNIALTMEPAPACEPEALRTRIEALKRILSEKER